MTLAEEVIKRKYPLFSLGRHEVSAQDLTQIEGIRKQAAKDPRVYWLLRVILREGGKNKPSEKLL